MKLKKLPEFKTDRAAEKFVDTADLSEYDLSGLKLVQFEFQKKTKRAAVHPGRILLEDLKDEGISINGLAQAIRVPANRISLIVNGKRGITADTAARLGRFFGTSAQYWLNIQNKYDLDSIDFAKIARDVIPAPGGLKVRFASQRERARTKRPMTKNEIEAEAKFAKEIYKDRAAINRKAEAVLASSGSRQFTQQPPVHPGEILTEEFLAPRGISKNKLARELGIPALRVDQIAKGRRGITADTAARLSLYFGNSTEFWMNLQASYDLRVERGKLPEIKRRVRTLQPAR